MSKFSPKSVLGKTHRRNFDNMNVSEDDHRDIPDNLNSRKKAQEHTVIKINGKKAKIEDLPEALVEQLQAGLGIHARWYNGVIHVVGVINLRTLTS